MRAMSSVLCTVHAENGELVYRLQKDIYEQGIHVQKVNFPVAKLVSGNAIRIAEVLGVPLYLVHTSCIDALEAVTRAKLEGQRVFAEVLAQHLVIDDSVYRNPDWQSATLRHESPISIKRTPRSVVARLAAGAATNHNSSHCPVPSKRKWKR